jgi:hypothetical protein
MKAFAIPICLLALAAQAADKPCTPADSKAALKYVDLVMTWGQLQKSVKDYGHCDSDAAVSDIFTDALMRLAVPWKNVDQFAGAMKDPVFRAFVVTHVKSPSASDDRSAVYSRATASCPAGQEAFCAELAAIIKGEPPKEAPKEASKDAPKEAAKEAPKDAK